MKIFIDDLELAIHQSGNNEFKLAEVPEQSVNKNQLFNYLNNQFQLKINDEEISLEFVGFEFDDDALLCYLEGKKIRKINSIEIQNALLTETFDDQINLTHFQYNGEMKSIKTVKERPSEIIDCSSW